MNSVLPFTYTLSAQVYVNRKTTTTVLPPPPWGRVGVGAANTPRSDKTTACAPAHRHYPNPPTTARPPTALPPPPWGRDGVWAASTPQSDKYKIAHHPYSPTATALPPSPCGGGAGGGVRPHTSLANRQPVKPFTYTLSAQVYVKHPGTECVPTHHLPPNLSTATRIPTVLPPPLQDAPASAAGGFPRKMHSHFAWGPGEGWGGGSVLASATDAKLSSCNPATITRIPTALPPPLQDAPASAAGLEQLARSARKGWGGGSAHDFAANAK